MYSSKEIKKTTRTKSAEGVSATMRTLKLRTADRGSCSFDPVQRSEVKTKRKEEATTARMTNSLLD